MPSDQRVGDGREAQALDVRPRRARHPRQEVDDGIPPRGRIARRDVQHARADRAWDRSAPDLATARTARDLPETRWNDASPPGEELERRRPRVPLVRGGVPGAAIDEQAVRDAGAREAPRAPASDTRRGSAAPRAVVEVALDADRPYSR